MDDKHPCWKVANEKMEETSEEAEKVTEQYESDKEEFMENKLSVTTFESRKVRNTAKQDTIVGKGKRSNADHSQGYKLAYFNLWWRRIEQEGTNGYRANESREELVKQSK